MTLSVCYITSRDRPLFDWFFDSLRSQVKPDDRIQVIVIDLHTRMTMPHWNGMLHYWPKPTVWQGQHRLTSKDWWAASNARNTGICLAQHSWIAFVDDRSVLLPGWLDAVREAQKGKYAVFGAYEKRTGMIVENGVITHGGIVVGEDAREKYVREHWGGTVPAKCPGEWAFGCTLALPLEWALAVNGYEELCDSLSMEDVIFGKHLANNGFDLRYDFRMKIIEDRTPSEIQGAMPRTSKERYPNDTEDKGHKALERFSNAKRAQHHWDLRKVRAGVMAGGQFPPADAPTRDWFDNQLIAEMKWPWVKPI